MYFSKKMEMESTVQLKKPKSSFAFTGNQFLMLAVAALGYFVDVYDLFDIRSGTNRIVAGHWSC
jgi:hypothetical protein